MHSYSILTAVTLGTAASAYQLPQNLKSIYDNHKVTTYRVFTDKSLTIQQAGSCSNRLSDKFPEGARYCGDISGAIYLKGSNGNYDNMDIDCDGANNHAGACSNDPSGQGETAFKDTVKKYGIPDLDANVHPYVVFGNDGASPSFDPQQHGIKPLSVMAVVCNGEVASIPQSIIDFLLTLRSTTASGEIPTAAPLPAKLQLLSPSFAFLTRVSMVTMAMVRRMFYTLPLRETKLSLERMVLIGRLRPVLISPRV